MFYKWYFYRKRAYISKNSFQKQQRLVSIYDLKQCSDLCGENENRKQTTFSNAKKIEKIVVNIVSHYTFHKKAD